MCVWPINLIPTPPKSRSRINPGIRVRLRHLKATGTGCKTKLRRSKELKSYSESFGWCPAMQTCFMSHKEYFVPYSKRVCCGSWGVSRPHFTRFFLFEPPTTVRQHCLSPLTTSIQNPYSLFHVFRVPRTSDQFCTVPICI